MTTISKLTLNPRVTGFATFSYAWWDEFFTPDQVEKIIQYCDKHGVEESHVVNGGENVVDSKIRKSQVKFHSPNEENKWIFEGLVQLAEFINTNYFNFDLTGFDNFQFTVYDGEGANYDWHTDLIFGPDFPIEMNLPRKLSFSMILSDPTEFEGGEFEISVSGEPIPIEQKKGRVIAFPSFVRHRVAPIKTGQRKSLVFWVVGPKFK